MQIARGCNVADQISACTKQHARAKDCGQANCHARVTRGVHLHVPGEQVLETLLKGVTTALSAAKRYRLACLQAVVLALMAPDAPPVRLPNPSAGDEEEPPADMPMTEDEQRNEVWDPTIACPPCVQGACFCPGGTCASLGPTCLGKAPQGLGGNGAGGCRLTWCVCIAKINSVASSDRI